MYGCESWTIKKAEPRRIEAFELWCWRRLESPLDCKEIHQSILKEISSGCSLEGLMLSWNSSTLATWCKELTHWKRPWCWERLKAGEGDDKGWDGWIASPTQWTWVWVNSRSWWWTGRPGVLQSMGWQRVGHDSDRTELIQGQGFGLDLETNATPLLNPYGCQWVCQHLLIYYNFISILRDSRASGSQICHHLGPRWLNSSCFFSLQLPSKT